MSTINNYTIQITKHDCWSLNDKRKVYIEIKLVSEENLYIGETKLKESYLNSGVIRALYNPKIFSRQ